ncbi:MAG: AAA family ATPase [Gaiellaceae bacterium]
MLGQTVCPSCGAGTDAGARFCPTCGGALVKPCASCGSETRVGAQFCASCGHRLDRAPAKEEERKLVTVLFADLTGSTALGEQLDPERLRALLSEYFAAMALVIESWGGTVEKFIGDAVMAVFGIPTLREDDALRAVRAASELHERIAGLNETLERELGVAIELRTGVNTGDVVAGDAAQGQAFATGDTVNVAARLQQTAGQGEIVIGATTFALVRDAVRAEPLPRLELKGKEQPVGALRLLEVFAGAPAFTRRLDAPFVGRADELAALVAGLDEAERESACRLVTITGAPGVGKSRLVRELLSATEGRARAVVGRCLSYGEGITYWPLAEIVRQVGGEDARARLAGLVGGTDGELVGERVAGAVGLAETTSRTEEIFWAVRRLFESLARDGPLVVVLDDVHWAESTLLDLVEYVLAFARAPLLLVCAARPDLFDVRPSWAAPRPGAALVSLQPLSEAESEALVAGLAGGPPARRVVEAAEGNPLFLEQLLAFESEDGHDGGRLATPPTIQALLGARIDRLEESERTVLERASVEGRLFHLGAVSELLPEQMRSLAGAGVLSLVRKELVRPDESLFPGDDGFRFTHILVRDVAYEGMPKAVRGKAHERFAAWLEGKAGARVAEYEEILAYHLEQAASYGRQVRPGDQRTDELARIASERLASVGRRALERGDVLAAANLLERALRLHLVDNEGRVDLVADLFECYFQAGHLTEAERLLADASAAATAEGERARATIDVLRAILEMQSDPANSSDRALRKAVRAVGVFDASGDYRGLSLSWRLIQNVHWQRGEVARSKEATEQALAHAVRAGDVHAQSVHRLAIGGALVFGEAPLGECASFMEGELQWAREMGIRAHEALALVGVGHMEAARGRRVEGLRLIEEGSSLLLDLGRRLDVAALVGNWAHITFDEPAQIARALRNAYEILSEAGEKGYLSTVAASLAETVLAQGDVGEAERLLDEAEEAGASDDVTTQVVVRRVRARVLALTGEWREAERLAREAAALASATEYVELRGLTLEALGDVLAATGKIEEARDARAGAVRVFEAKGFTVLADRARARLAELQATGSPSQ